MSEEWDWESLTTLSVPSNQLRQHLGRLLGRDAEARRRAGGLLYCEVANQGHLYSTAAPCVDIIAEHVESGGGFSSDSIALLESILNARSPGLQVTVDGARVDVSEYCRKRILDLLPEILREADGEDVQLFREVCFLIPQLADSSPEVIEFLKLSISRFEGELRRVSSEALEEAQEVLRDGHIA
ncbi:hypothetical protein [Streptomyces soliscabiei]|uniref:hypothetical protein n=1 Tax=Streptomyces soliscabiei TaxID=588897 RepID=UPI0029A189FC|nr:hypothetical protein [Streptomyces sp. NY05-11A]MDX2682451.1 hypothetical protein [Streptomyces sp. NY05-11A]